jgi:hypothetical protein
MIQTKILNRFASLAFIFILLSSCKKDRNTCYECDITPERNGVYTYIGCFTEDDWRTGVQTDAVGNPIDKDERCREYNQ